MSFPTQNSLHSTIKQLKDIVSRLQRDDREALRLVRKMEILALRIERKTRLAAKNKQAVIVSTTGNHTIIEVQPVAGTSDTAGATI